MRGDLGVKMCGRLREKCDQNKKTIAGGIYPRGRKGLDICCAAMF